MRESPAQSYCLVQDGTGQTSVHQSHNPKVVGSNPTPATTYNSRSEALSEESGRAFLLPRRPELPLFFHTFQSDGLVAGGTGRCWTARVTAVEADRWGRRPRRPTFAWTARSHGGAPPDAQRMLGVRS